MALVSAVRLLADGGAFEQTQCSQTHWTPQTIWINFSYKHEIIWFWAFFFLLSFARSFSWAPLSSFNCNFYWPLSHESERKIKKIKTTRSTLKCCGFVVVVFAAIAAERMNDLWIVWTLMRLFTRSALLLLADFSFIFIIYYYFIAGPESDGSASVRSTLVCSHVQQWLPIFGQQTKQQFQHKISKICFFDVESLRTANPRMNGNKCDAIY